MQIGVLKGDGIGPELVEATRLVVDACGADITWLDIPVADDAIELYGHPVPSESIKMLRDVKIAIKGPFDTKKHCGSAKKKYPVVIDIPDLQ